MGDATQEPPPSGGAPEPETQATPPPAATTDEDRLDSEDPAAAEDRPGEGVQADEGPQPGEARIDEEERESFPASDPHADWAGPSN